MIVGVCASKSAFKEESQLRNTDLLSCRRWVITPSQSHMRSAG